MILDQISHYQDENIKIHDTKSVTLFTFKCSGCVIWLTAGIYWIVMVVISSLRLDLGGFLQGTQTAGSSFKVPLSLLERIILEGELQWTERGSRNSRPVHFPHSMRCNGVSCTTLVFFHSTHGRHMLSSLLPKRKNGHYKQDLKKKPT